MDKEDRQSMEWIFGPRTYGACSDGASDQEHHMMIDETGQCPWCHEEG